jgi:hypothetical protein
MKIQGLLPLALLAWICGASSMVAQADEIHTNFYQRSGCLTPGDHPVRFQALAFDLSKYELGLRGSRPDGLLPTLDDVASAEKAGNSADFSLQHSVKEKDLAAANVGYPEDPEYFAASGLVRIAGKDLSDRDTEATFKNAMLCLNEAEYNQVGSRVVVFNAFEDFRPIQLNDRLRETNCVDVVQVGPRIVEYRAKEGIKIGANRKPGQRYAIFAQGNGDVEKNAGYLGYLFIFEDQINLYQVQKFLLSPDAGHLGEKMRVGVVITTDAYSGYAWRAQDGTLKSVGAVSRPHPVFLIVRQMAQ